jgi:hypothetical protein
MDEDVRQALESLRAALANQRGRRVLLITLHYSDGAADVLAVPAPAPTPPDSQPAAPGSSRLRQQILDTLGQATEPVKAGTIARRCGRSNSGHFREVLRGLIEDGEVVEHPGHTYWLPQAGE